MNVYVMLCKTEFANSTNWPISMYRTIELANSARLANWHANWPIRQFLKLVVGIPSGPLCTQILVKIES